MQRKYVLFLFFKFILLQGGTHFRIKAPDGSAHEFPLGFIYDFPLQ